MRMLSALLQEFAKTHLVRDGEAYGPYCPVLDVGLKTLHPGVKSVVARMKDIQAACRDIVALWPTITADD